MTGNRPPSAQRLHRRHCRLHMLSRAEARGLNLTVPMLFHLERRIERMRCVFERPGQERYRVTLVLSGEYFIVVYDTRLRCLVTMLSLTRQHPAARAEIVRHRDAR